MMWVCIHQSIHSVGLVECYGCFLCNMLSHVCRSSTHSQEDPVLRRIEACTIYISYQCYDLLHTSDLTKYHGTIVLPTRGICRLSIWVVNRPFLYLTMLRIQTRCYVMYMVTELIILIRFLVHFALANFFPSSIHCAKKNKTYLHNDIPLKVVLTAAAYFVVSILCLFFESHTFNEYT